MSGQYTSYSGEQIEQRKGHYWSSSVSGGWDKNSLCEQTEAAVFLGDVNAYDM